MITGLIPHRYAKALYKFAGESGKTKKVYEEMNGVIASFSSNPDLQRVMSNPFVDDADKEKVMLAAVGKAAGEDYHRFVKLVLDHNREDLIYLMALAYRDIYRKENHISQVKITTAAKLPEKELDKLKNVVEKYFHDTTFEYDVEVDPSIIGGFVINVDSTRMDASMKGELEELRQNLLEI